MSLERTALVTLIACALPIWLLVEELLHRCAKRGRDGARAPIDERNTGTHGRRPRRVTATVTLLVVALPHAAAVAATPRRFPCPRSSAPTPTAASRGS